MFIVLLKKTEKNGHRAREFMNDHKAWVKEGLDAGVFILAGSLEGGKGGCIIAHNTTLEDLTAMINNDPFVTENIIEPEITMVDPVMMDNRLGFLKE